MNKLGRLFLSLVGLSVFRAIARAIGIGTEVLRLDDHLFVRFSRDSSPQIMDLLIASWWVGLLVVSALLISVLSRWFGESRMEHWLPVGVLTLITGYFTYLIRETPSLQTPILIIPNLIFIVVCVILWSSILGWPKASNSLAETGDRWKKDYLLPAFRISFKGALIWSAVLSAIWVLIGVIPTVGHLFAWLFDLLLSIYYFVWSIVGAVLIFVGDNVVMPLVLFISHLF